MPRISFPDRLQRFVPLLAVLFSFTVALSTPVAAADDEMAAIRRTGEAFVRVSRKITPSVVNIRTFRKVPQREFDFADPFFGDMFEPFRDFFGREFGRRFQGRQEGELVQTGLGSGVIVRPEGLVLTNNHVIEGAQEIRVTLDDRTEVPASVVGRDPRTDIAVLRLPPGEYAWAPLGNSDAIQIGEWVVAVGNPFGLGQSVTVGVVSAKGRADIGITELEDFIQTDAAINPGNSGGPLVNLDGEVIGINTAIFSKSGGYQGIGFAVPSNLAALILDSLLKTGRVIRSDLALRVEDIPEKGGKTGAGVVVVEVVPGGVAQKAGISLGDIIVKVNGREVRGSDSFY
ncbi:MAG: trypsin-like peptidase domain-containing protein, partial [Proteobacteria bacterium]|nr:trypsin-like peptidase domain-containing protein [Pseudomonadota bacterium]